VTEVFWTGRCDRCGMSVGFEDSLRQDFCECDPRCECCGEQLFASARLPKGMCEGCLVKEIEEEFSTKFLDSLTGDQMVLLMEEFARKYE
jgi:hypothetical protein